MIDTAIYTLLTQHAGAGVKVVPVTDTVTEDLPKVIFNRIGGGGPREYTDSGPVGIASPRYKIDIFAATLLDAGIIADRIRIALDCFKGAAAETEILLITFPEGPRADRAQVVSGQNFVVARVILEMVVTHRERLTAAV